METRLKQIRVPTVNEVMAKNMPEKKFRSGAIVATVWGNEATRDGKKIIYNTVSFERSYKDKEGAWKTTNSLRMHDLPRAALVLNKAYEYLALNDQVDEENIY